MSLGNAHFDHGGIGHFNNGLIAHSVNGGFDHFDNGAIAHSCNDGISHFNNCWIESLTLIMVVCYFEKWSVTEYFLSQHTNIKYIYLVFLKYLKNWV